jgi:hypothetical protein
MASICLWRRQGGRINVCAMAREGEVRGLALIDVGDFQGPVLLGAQFVVCVEVREAWGGRVADLGGGGIVVLGASSWLWPLIGAWGDGGLAVKQALN